MIPFSTPPHPPQFWGEICPFWGTHLRDGAADFEGGLPGWGGGFVCPSPPLRRYWGPSWAPPPFFLLRNRGVFGGVQLQHRLRPQSRHQALKFGGKNSDFGAFQGGKMGIWGQKWGFGEAMGGTGVKNGVLGANWGELGAWGGLC